MTARLPRPISKIPWKEHRSPTGHEYYSYPTPLARKVWLYVRVMGKTRPLATFQHGHHDEDGFILHFVTRGRLAHRIHDRTHTAGKGEACLFDVASSVTYGKTGGGKLAFQWVWFNGRDVPLLFQELRADENPIFAPLDAARMDSLFRELMELVSRQPPAYEIRASAMLSLMLAELFASRSPRAGATTLPQPRPLSVQVRRSLDYIARFYEYPLTVKQIAAKAGQSLHYFSRLFHREIGMPPITYLNRHRIEQAKGLLEMSNKSIEEIAHTVGFADPDYFARAFRKIAGVSPRQYRSEKQKPAAGRARSRPKTPSTPGRRH